jgi:hypothetical protein
MLSASVLITTYLRFKLGGSSEYRENIVVTDSTPQQDAELPTELAGDDDTDKKAGDATKVSVLTKEAV